MASCTLQVVPMDPIKTVSSTQLFLITVPTPSAMTIMLAPQMAVTPSPGASISGFRVMTPIHVQRTCATPRQAVITQLPRAVPRPHPRERLHLPARLPLGLPQVQLPLRPLLRLEHHQL